PLNRWTCRSKLLSFDPEAKERDGIAYPWTDITWVLHRYGVSGRYYVAPGTQPDCDTGAMFCPPKPQYRTTPEIWNPLPDFQTVHQDRQVRDVQDTGAFLRAARTGTLPRVSWVVPNGKQSEHPPASVAAGQAYVTRLVNEVMAGPDWGSTAIFLT